MKIREGDYLAFELNIFIEDDRDLRLVESLIDEQLQTHRKIFVHSDMECKQDYCVENKQLSFVYILRCKEDKLYTGYTNNLLHRLNQHQNKKGAKYTKAFGPCTLVYYEMFPSKSLAMKREYQIKQLTKKEKEALISGFKK